MIIIMPTSFCDLLAASPGSESNLSESVVLFQRGDPVERLYQVREGEVHLLRRQEGGGAALLQRALPGDIVAEASLLSTTYHCDAETVAPTRLMSWPRAQVAARVEQDPGAALAYADHLASQVRTARQRAEIAALRRVGERLDAWLTWHDGNLPEKGRRHLLARELGVSPEALYREIARRQAAS